MNVFNAFLCNIKNLFFIGIMNKVSRKMYFFHSNLFFFLPVIVHTNTWLYIYSIFLALHKIVVLLYYNNSHSFSNFNCKILQFKRKKEKNCQLKNFVDTNKQNNLCISVGNIRRWFLKSVFAQNLKMMTQIMI